MIRSTASRTTRLLVGAVGALSLFAAACSDDDGGSTDTAAPATEAPATSAATETTTADTAMPETTMAAMFEGDLVGTFQLTSGDCTSGTPAGSYFAMVQPGGTADAGPFVPNADSTCSDLNYSLLVAGADGGLVTGQYQPAPDPAFDATGNGLADGIFAPVTFFGVAFAGATDSAGTMPSITAAGGTLTGDLSAFTAYYGGGSFNQGAPKPDGTGDAPTGTIDPETGAFVLEWSSVISGGSFDGFTGVWHLEGTFVPAG